MGMIIRDSSGTWVNVSGFDDQPEFNSPFVIEDRRTYSFMFGEASITQLRLPDLHIIYGDMVLCERELAMRSANRMDFVELHFTLRGNCTLENHINGHTYISQTNHHNMYYMPDLDGTGSYDPNGSYQLFEIHFAKSRFLELAKNSTIGLQAFAEKVDSGEFAEISLENRPITLAMHQCIQDILHCKYKGGLKAMFLQSKCTELLVLQAESFLPENSEKAGKIIKTGYDRDCIYQAKEYLLNHLETPPSVPELAKIVGINEFKLKNGFREIFNNSVFGYLSEFRLGQAKDLLLAGVPIKSISEDLGYSSVQHFGTAFRKKFGVSPGKIKLV